MKKTSILLTVIMGIALLFAGAGLAEIPAPPVNQTIGFPDIPFDALTEAECRVCHSSGIPDRHHMLYGTALPVGECTEAAGLICADSGNDGTPCTDDADCDNSTGTAVCAAKPCLTDADCAVGTDVCQITGDPCGVGTCSGSGDNCTTAADCPPTEDCLGECPREYTGQTCGQPFCFAASSAPNAGDVGGVMNCLACHDQDTTGGVTNFIVYRDCLFCHSQNPDTPTVHHDAAAGGLAKTGECVACHGDVVDNMADGHYIPTYSPSLVTPQPVAHRDQCVDSGNDGTACVTDADCDNSTGTAVCESVATFASGGCNFCHDGGVDTASGLVVVTNHDNHHHAGLHKNALGGSDRDWCNNCHLDGRGEDEDPLAIRTCEGCHGPESLHNIQADDGTDGVITVGGEMAGYGHIGADNPGSGSDCWGCHGFGAASAPSSGPVVPQIDSLSPQVITAGAAAQITLSGSGLVNVSGGTVMTSTVVLTAADGTTIDLGRDTISPISVKATVPATVPAGVYAVRAVKADTQSNAAILAIIPGAEISQVMCDACSGAMTISGSGFGDAPPAGAEAYINVVQDGVVLDVISWSNDVIEAVAASCNGGSVTVNTLYGSATK